MADGIVGKAFTRRFRTGVTGQTFTSTALSTKPDGTAWTPAVTSVADDTYEVSFTPDQEGVWVADVTDGNGNIFRGEYDILAAPTTTFSRVTSGQRLRSADINQLQQRLEELPY